ncbi:3-oxoacyl-ACP reductase [Sulfolobus sp. A20]|uniref:SDR family oxidoreductase n=1 Tax=Saccharolobus sp. A20 TaxID=1891280 RepID=UPI000846198C|nr:SDR family oxidoreductase [Sulfolobus sp. A20]TRM75278.1 SDR family NAD(P)-dependent oxidoreductase [Sulfolobus sp. E5]TRM78905.1 SDR family NAD(P)-dependent oxidoreductase [Sulfolobus sp. B5]TRM83136.1 SDR family NAD(P)-dependent oxidoreductase [Sulfolobus sp. A20-N-F6]TRM86913.1 SDR family NAD(P)-dependent oxidoreductase [Sulfolobus sp. C3]TRM88747.1 SDR family NAD(P)-dependent oxidoreductase [Sulfolobus sp. E3]TRM93028.1 SDR family NAD(P)-dependent oxidoreductase [Sulfolobus sp. A20-N-G
MYSLKDKVVVVTGSGRGIGRAIAVRLAKEGSLLVVNAKKRIEEMNETINIIKSVGGEAIGVLADVSTREGCETLLKATLERYGVVDVLVNNAGLGLYSPFINVDDKLLDKHISTDFKSVVYCSQVFAKEMRENGAILNMASVAGVSPAYGLSIYGAMKAAVIALTKYLALELSPKIRVNAIAPGFVKTKLGESMFQLLGMTEKEFAQKFTLMGKILDPEEVAEFVTAVLKIESLTGQVFVLDSGEAIKGGIK